MDHETLEIIDYFLTESREAVAEVEPLLIELESEGGQPDKATIDSIFRLFHSMKGSAGFLDFGHVEGVTHHAETLLDLVRTGRLEFSASVVDVLCRALDFTTAALERIEKTQSDKGLADHAEAIIERIKAMDNSGPPPVAVSTPASDIPAFFEPPPPEPELIAPVFGEGPSRSTSSGMVAIFDDVPPMVEESQEALSSRLGQILLDGGYVNQTQLDSALQDPSLPVGEQLVQSGAVDIATVRTALDVQDQLRQGPPELVASPKLDGPSRRRAEYLRVDVRKLDQLMDLIGELIIAETAMTHGPGTVGSVRGRSKAAVQLNRITRALQDVAMSLRMVPIAPTFNKMKRLVRDLSRRQGKSVSLHIGGEETEVDKSIVESISAPLVHLIRNAIDHGIESESDRVAAGKPQAGQVRLTARQQAGEICIVVQDDGKGMSRDKILQTALERGLVRGDGSDMTDSEVFRLIFEAGFSTVDAVTDISGRGVGMDVVRQNIESIKGRVDIASTPGLGTTITLRIPLTLAIIEGMLVRVGKTRFTIPILSILETVVVRDADVTKMVGGQEVARVRGELLPVFRLHRFYDIEPDSSRIDEGLLVVVEYGKHRLCLLVDELIGQRQTVVKALSGYLGDLRGLAGCTVLGDGAISLIIDVAKLIQDTRAAAA